MYSQAGFLLPLSLLIHRFFIFFCRHPHDLFPSPKGCMKKNIRGRKTDREAEERQTERQKTDRMTDRQRKRMTDSQKKREKE